MKIEQIGIVLPARNEAPRLGRCLHALARAAAAVKLPVTVALVLDSCTDDSARRVEQLRAALALPLLVVSTGAGSAGAARRLGVDRLVAELGSTGTWVASSDADSTVPPGWLLGQVRHAAAGAELIAGTVRVDDWQIEGRSATLQSLADAEYALVGDGAGHRHVHGANLGIAAELYRRVDGFAPVTHDEDVRLVAVALAAGAAMVWATDICVATSARSAARAPHGFGAYLDQLASAEDCASALA